MLTQPPATLGFGLRRLVSVAAVYAMRPRLFVLDEPTAELDWRSAHELLDRFAALHRQGHTVLLISHDMELVAEYAERVLLMHDGRIVADAPPAAFFGATDTLRASSLTAPQVVQLGQRLRDLGLSSENLTVDAFVADYVGALPPGRDMLASLYQPAASWLHRLDARVKLLGVVCGLALIFSIGNVWLMIATVALEQACYCSARVGRGRVGWVWRMIWVTVALVFVLWVLLYPLPGPAFWSWWWLRLTWEGLARGLVVAVRLAAVAFLLFGWLFTTSEVHLVLSLAVVWPALCLGADAGDGFALCAHHGRAFSHDHRGASRRGGSTSPRAGPLAKARAYVPITVAMLISALRTATNLAYALESRALGATTHRTSLLQLRFRRADLLWALGIVLGTGALLTARLAWGWGALPLALFGG